METTTYRLDPAAESGDYLTAGGYRTHDHECGTGDPVLLIHGSGPGVSAWANWRGVIPHLAARIRVLVPDLLGFGYSERPAGIDYGKERWVEHVIAFLEFNPTAATTT